MTNNSTIINLSSNVSDSANVGPFTLISQDAVIEASAMIGAQVTVGVGVHIGERVKIQSGAQLCDGCVIESDVTVGVNATIASGIRLHMGAIIESGTNVIMDVPPYAIITCPESTITGYVDAKANNEIEKVKSDLNLVNQEPSRVRGVRLHKLPNHLDMRGNLSVGEFEKDLPFYPKRYFLVYGVTNERIRGEHAHYNCHQFLLCIHGACSVIADDGFERQEFHLDQPTFGLYIPPMIWGIQYKFTRDAVLLVFASEHYDSDDYLRNYSEFRKIARQNEVGE